MSVVLYRIEFKWSYLLLLKGTFFWILEKAGLLAHDFKGAGNSIYRHIMFDMKRRENSGTGLKST
jgi:hypothetical protein